MKKYILILVAAAATAFTVFDVFNELSITEEKGKELLLTSIAEGWMSTSFEINQKARALSSESKVEAIRQLINFAKEYSKTDAFKNDYKKWRKNNLPARFDANFSNQSQPQSSRTCFLLQPAGIE